MLVLSLNRLVQSQAFDIASHMFGPHLAWIGFQCEGHFGGVSTSDTFTSIAKRSPHPSALAQHDINHSINIALHLTSPFSENKPQQIHSTEFFSIMKPALLILSSAALALAGPIIPTMVPDSEISAITTSTDNPLPIMKIFEGPWPPQLSLCVEGEPPSKYPLGCCEHYIGELCVQERFTPPDEDPEHEPRPTHRFFEERPRHMLMCARGDPPHDLYPCDNWWEQVNFDEEFGNEPGETETARAK